MTDIIVTRKTLGYIKNHGSNYIEEDKLVVGLYRDLDSNKSPYVKKYIRMLINQLESM